jgi:hypothetical protein
LLRFNLNKVVRVLLNPHLKKARVTKKPKANKKLLLKSNLLSKTSRVPNHHQPTSKPHSNCSKKRPKPLKHKNKLLDNKHKIITSPTMKTVKSKLFKQRLLNFKHKERKL